MGQTKRLYEIQGLHCANCALKIERELNQLSYVQSAVVNSVTSKAILEVDENTNREIIFDDVESISTRIEHGVRVKEIEKNIISKKNVKVQGNVKSINSSSKDNKVKEEKVTYRDFHSDDHVHNHNHDHGEGFKKKQIIKFIIGISLAVAGVLTKDMISLFLFIASYLVIGGDILLIAGKNIIKGQVFDENFLMSIATIGAFLIGEYPEAIGVMLFYQIGVFSTIGS